MYNKETKDEASLDFESFKAAWRRYPSVIKLLEKFLVVIFEEYNVKFLNRVHMGFFIHLIKYYYIYNLHKIIDTTIYSA